MISDGEYMVEEGSGEVDWAEGEYWPPQYCCSKRRSDEGMVIPKFTGGIKLANPAVVEYGLYPSVGDCHPQLLSWE